MPRNILRKILITGSSGFIGTHMVNYLVMKGYSVYGLDVRMPRDRPKGFSFLKCDILDRFKLKTAIERIAPDAIIQLAARTDLNETKNLDGYAANIEGVDNLLSAVRSFGKVNRCIYTSSQLVCRIGYVPHDDHDYCPNTLYGKSKVLTEKIVRQQDGGGCEWCLTRPTTVWGPGMQPHYQKFFRMICQGRYFHIGRRPLYKSYGYIGNIVYQHEKLLKASIELIHRKTFYLSDYEPISLREWVNGFQKELGSKPIATVPEYWAKVAATLGDIINKLGFKSFVFNSFRLSNILTEYQFDLEDTKIVCGPLPFSIRQGIKETAAWIRTLN